jgi:hypothetical protein
MHSQVEHPSPGPLLWDIKFAEVLDMGNTNSTPKIPPKTGICYLIECKLKLDGLKKKELTFFCKPLDSHMLFYFLLAVLGFVLRASNLIGKNSTT